VADADHRRPDSVWLRVLLTNLVASGDYGHARAIWSSVGAGHRSAGLIYDAGFSEPQAPPPFNWSFASASVGLAERQPGGKLHVIFYGNEDGPLASQLLLLSPGTYRLQMQIVGAAVHPETLHWSVRCDKSSEAFANDLHLQPVRPWAQQQQLAGERPATGLSRCRRPAPRSGSSSPDARATSRSSRT
jgi:hypothetical protein